MKIKKILTFVFVILFLSTILLQAKKIATLEDIMRPDAMEMGNNRLYITERATIYIYSLEDFRLVKKFGKEGEGPREFRIIPFGPPLAAEPYNDKIYVSSDAKVSVFTKDGEFIKETRAAPFKVFIPFMDKYLTTGVTTDDKKQTVLSVNLYNEKFENVKEVYASDIQVGPSFSWNFPMNSFAFVPYKNRFYLVFGKEGFVIDVFDKTGTKLYRIKKDYKPLKVLEEYKNKTLNWFKNSPNYKQTWDFFKTRISFKTHYPAIRDMDVTDDRIYVLTYKKQNGNSECIIMDLQGKEIKRVFVPCPDMYGMDFYPKYYYYKRAFYTLVENEDDEVWELHRSDVIK
ncbi:MAG: hypothetical protein GTO45_28285 [Candidatus Aminicenantes bacterium]|nr:hypothetical protein [Candidatus Aminicenantes bacterium]NIM82701.1 hypothetical protein [Candidatus Aminicenantes bacterium]NIN22072.1 hypothetical protein [Candidatus Aminicenantes bacterium]NIN45831.1 hypothetical protein [Candidatus Aminicenantes bacterium]NIN88668.1 hypothetical protein [Candidatus Aminicenantes bacterium]